MGTVRKIGNEYYIEFEARGLMYHQKAGFNKQKAKALLKAVEEKIQQGEMGIIVRDIDTDIFFKSFLQYAKVEYPFRSLKRYEGLVEHFNGFLLSQKPCIKKISEITPIVVEKYRIGIIQKFIETFGKVKPHALNLTLLLLGDIFNYAIKLGYLNDNPTLHIPFEKKICQRRLFYFSDAEVKKLTEYHDQFYARIFTIMLYTGITIQELAGLRWRDIDWGKHTLCVSSNAIDKSRRQRFIPATDALLSSFRQISKNSKSKFEHIFISRKDKANFCKKIALDFQVIEKELKLSVPLTSTNLRNTFVRILLKRGVSLLRINQLLGYQDIAKILPYFVFLPDTKEKISVYEFKN